MFGIIFSVALEDIQAIARSSPSAKQTYRVRKPRASFNPISSESYIKAELLVHTVGILFATNRTAKMEHSKMTPISPPRDEAAVRR